MRPLEIVSFLDGRLGHEKQTKGVLQALGRLTPVRIESVRVAPPNFKTVGLNWFYYLVSPAARSKKRARRTDLIIGTGTGTHLPMLMYKKKCGAKVVTCMTPDFPLKHAIDLCFVPRHDRQKPAINIFPTLGPPSTVLLSDAHDRNRGLILVGGLDPKSHHWQSETVLEQVENILANDQTMTWTISSSPRTPRETIFQLERLAAENSKVFFYKSEDTPAGWIEAQYAQNDIVWVTADSMSMIFEALTAGCRVGILPVKWKHRNNKFQKSLAHLLENNTVTAYSSWLAGEGLSAKAARLDEASRCAREILRRWWPERLP